MGFNEALAARRRRDVDTLRNGIIWPFLTGAGYDDDKDNRATALAACVVDSPWLARVIERAERIAEGRLRTRLRRVVETHSADLDGTDLGRALTGLLADAED